MSLQFEDNSAEVKRRLSESLIRFLYEAGGDLTSQIQQNSRVDTGQTKGSYKYKVNESDLTAIVGSNLENAIWEEFGTGEYALKGNGRKGAWYVPVDNYTGSKKPTYNGKVVIVYGKNGKKFYKTNGKKPNRPLDNAFKSLKTKLIKRFGQILTDKIGR